MLAQFRKRYPQGSLISKLVKIDRGQYIVKVSIQIEGIAIATGLAAANTVEEAEDRARNRALALLDLNEAVTTPPELTQTKENKKIEPPIAIAQPLAVEKNEATESLSLSSNGVTLSKTERIFPSESPLNLQPETTKIRRQEAGGRRQEEIFPSESPLNLQPETTKIRRQEAGGRRQEEIFPSESPLNLQPETTKMPEPEKEDLSSDRAIISTTPTQLPLETVMRSPEPEPQPESISPDISPDISFDEMVLQTTVHMKRLGWTDKQGRDYLVEAYGKRSRHLLNDEELREFLHYLESQPTQ